MSWLKNKIWMGANFSFISNQEERNLYSGVYIGAILSCIFNILLICIPSLFFYWVCTYNFRTWLMFFSFRSLLLAVGSCSGLLCSDWFLRNTFFTRESDLPQARLQGSHHSIFKDGWLIFSSYLHWLALLSRKREEKTKFAMIIMIIHMQTIIGITILKLTMEVAELH